VSKVMNACFRTTKTAHFFVAHISVGFIVYVVCLDSDEWFDRILRYGGGSRIDLHPNECSTYVSLNSCALTGERTTTNASGHSH
jgi:hypothetical protein